MQYTPQLRRLILWTGTAAFMALLFGSLLFWKERMFFTDAAYHLFYIISKDDYAIQNTRFVAYFTQSFPLLATKLHLSLSHAAMWYSVSFPILYLITFWLLCLVFKNYKVALTYLLLSFLMTRASFYWCLSEVIQGFAFFALYLAFLMKRVEAEVRMGPAARVLMLCCMLAVVFSHPIILFSVSFSFLFFILHYPAKRYLLIREGILFVGLLLLKGLLLGNKNDAASSASLMDGIKRFPHYLDMQSNRNFFSYLLLDYHWVGLLFAAGLFFYLRRNRWKMWLLFCFFTGFVLMNNLAAPNGADQFYIENRYMGLCLFVVLPFVWDILPQIKMTFSRRLLLPLVMIACLLGIFRHHTVYTERLGILRSYVSAMKAAQSDKWIIPVEKVPKDRLMMVWGLSYEIWLVSTCEFQQTYSLLCREDKEAFKWLEDCNTCFGTEWETNAYADLPKRYFLLKHTGFPYAVREDGLSVSE